MGRGLWILCKWIGGLKMPDKKNPEIKTSGFFLAQK